MKPRTLLLLASVPAYFALVLAQAFAQTPNLLEQSAKGIIEQNCVTCHGEAQMSGLDMRQREKILKGGNRGPAVVPGKPEQSLFYQAAAHLGNLKMPPGKDRLRDADLKML